MSKSCIDYPILNCGLWFYKERVCKLLQVFSLKISAISNLVFAWLLLVTACRTTLEWRGLDIFWIHFYHLLQVFEKTLKWTNADRALLLRRLQAAWAVVAHTAGRVSLTLTFLLDLIMHLMVLSHARWEFGSQMDQSLLVVWKWRAMKTKTLHHTTSHLLCLCRVSKHTELGPIQKFSCCTYLTFS